MKYIELLVQWVTALFQIKAEEPELFRVFEL